MQKVLVLASKRQKVIRDLLNQYASTCRRAMNHNLGFTSNIHELFVSF